MEKYVVFNNSSIFGLLRKKNPIKIVLPDMSEHNEDLKRRLDELERTVNQDMDGWLLCLTKNKDACDEPNDS